MNQLTDGEIVSKVKEGDKESFGVIVERYGQKITRYGRKFLSDRKDIEDLVQEIFIKAYANIQSFRSENKFSSWLYRIAHNEFVNAIRKKKWALVPVFDFDAVFPHLAAPEMADQEANEREIKNMLDSCLEQLSPKYREPLVLYYFEEMNYQEIADILRIPASTVGVRLNRGRTILKKIFNKKYLQNGTK